MWQCAQYQKRIKRGNFEFVYIQLGLCCILRKYRRKPTELDELERKELQTHVTAFLIELAELAQKHCKLVIVSQIIGSRFYREFAGVEAIEGQVKAHFEKSTTVRFVTHQKLATGSPGFYEEVDRPRAGTHLNEKGRQLLLRSIRRHVARAHGLSVWVEDECPLPSVSLPRLRARPRRTPAKKQKLREKQRAKRAKAAKSQH